MKRSEVYFAELADTYGYEQNGVRPVLILQNDFGNENSPTTIVAPITSKKKKRRLPVHVGINNANLEQGSTVLLEQIRTIDITRLSSYICTLTEDEMRRVDRALFVSVGLSKKYVIN